MLNIVSMVIDHGRDEYLDFLIVFELNNDVYNVQVNSEIERQGIINKFYFNRDFIMINDEQVYLSENEIDTIENMVMEHFRSLFN